MISGDNQCSALFFRYNVKCNIAMHVASCQVKLPCYLLLSRQLRLESCQFKLASCQPKLASCQQWVEQGTKSSARDFLLLSTEIINFLLCKQTY